MVPAVGVVPADAATAVVPPQDSVPTDHLPEWIPTKDVVVGIAARAASRVRTSANHVVVAEEAGADAGAAEGEAEG